MTKPNFPEQRITLSTSIVLGLTGYSFKPKQFMASSVMSFVPSLAKVKEIHLANFFLTQV